MFHQNLEMNVRHVHLECDDEAQITVLFHLEGRMCVNTQVTPYETLIPY
jgi:hypothetical protein